MKKIWFRRKRYGWGWTPSSVEGWIVMAVYIFVMVGVVSSVNETASPSDVVIGVIIPAIILTLALILVCYITGEKPKWQWGKEPDTE